MDAAAHWHVRVRLRLRIDMTVAVPLPTFPRGEVVGTPAWPAPPHLGGRLDAAGVVRVALRGQAAALGAPGGGVGLGAAALVEAVGACGAGPVWLVAILAVGEVAAVAINLDACGGSKVDQRGRGAAWVARPRPPAGPTVHEVGWRWPRRLFRHFTGAACWLTVRCPAMRCTAVRQPRSPVSYCKR